MADEHEQEPVEKSEADTRKKVPIAEYRAMQGADSLNKDSMVGPADPDGYIPSSVKEVTYPKSPLLKRVGGWMLAGWTLTASIYGIFALPRDIWPKVLETLLPGSTLVATDDPSKPQYMPSEEEIANPTFEGFVKFITENAVKIDPDGRYPTQYDALKARAKRTGRYNEKTGKITLKESIEPHEKLNLKAIEEGKKAFSDLFEFEPAGVFEPDITWRYNEIQRVNDEGEPSILADAYNGPWKITITFYPVSTDNSHDRNVETARHELLHGLVGMRHIEDILPFAPCYHQIAQQYSTVASIMDNETVNLLDNQSLGLIDLEVLERYTGFSLPVDKTAVQEVNINAERTRTLHLKGDNDRVDFRHGETPESSDLPIKVYIHTGNGGLSNVTTKYLSENRDSDNIISVNRGEIEQIHLFTNEDMEAKIFTTDEANQTFVSEEGDMAVQFSSGYGGAKDRMRDTGVNDNTGDSIVFNSDITLQSVVREGDNIMLTLQYPGSDPFTVTLEGQTLGQNRGVEAIVFVDVNDAPRRFTGEDIHTVEGIQAAFDTYRGEYNERLSEQLDLTGRLAKLQDTLASSYIPKDKRRALEVAAVALQDAIEAAEEEVESIERFNENNPTSPAVTLPDIDNITGITVLEIGENTLGDKDLKLRIENDSEVDLTLFPNEQKVRLTFDGEDENMLSSIWLRSERNSRDIAKVNIEVDDININDLESWAARLNEGLEALKEKTVEEEKKVKLFLGIVDEGTAIFSVDFDDGAVHVNTTSTNADNVFEKA